jgi:hypothetical protein
VSRAAKSDLVLNNSGERSTHRLPEFTTWSEFMFCRQMPKLSRYLILALSLGAVEIHAPLAQSGPSTQSPAPTPTSTNTRTVKTSPYRPNPFAGRAGKYYSLVWGVDSLKLKAAESGALIRFSYESWIRQRRPRSATKKPSQRSSLRTPAQSLSSLSRKGGATAPEHQPRS